MTLRRFLLALTAAYKPAKSITGTGDTVQHGLLAAEVLFEFLDSRPDIVDAPDATELKGDRMSVAFDDVSFEYVAGEAVLKNISLSVPPAVSAHWLGHRVAARLHCLICCSVFMSPSLAK